MLYECDLSLIAIPSLAHKRLHYYSIPYSQINYLIIGRADKPFSGLKDLSQSVVLVHKGTISETKLKSLPQDLFSSIIKVQSTPIGIKMLAEGTADYMVIDDHSIQSFVNDIFRNNLNIFPSNF